MVARCMLAGNRGGEMAVSAPSMSIDDQETFVREGAAAALDAKTRTDCPYGDRSLEWSNWLYGFAYASVELMQLKSGQYLLSSTESPPSHFELGRAASIPVRQAIESGTWKPVYVTLATLDEIERVKAAI